MTTTLSDLRGPTGPFLLEVLLTNPRDPSQREWRLQRAVGSEKEGLKVAMLMSQAYQYRLFLGAEHGYLYLDWQDTDDDYCGAAWVRRD